MKTWFLNLFGVLGEFLKALFQRGLQDQLNALLPIALQAVAQAAVNPDLISSSERREAAFQQIRSQALTSSINAGASSIGFAIELAVQKLKADQEK